MKTVIDVIHSSWTKLMGYLFWWIRRKSHRFSPASQSWLPSSWVLSGWHHAKIFWMWIWFKGGCCKNSLILIVCGISWNCLILYRNQEAAHLSAQLKFKFLRPIGQQVTPSYKSLIHIYVYIYIFLCSSLWSNSKITVNTIKQQPLTRLLPAGNFLCLKQETIMLLSYFKMNW